MRPKVAARKPEWSRMWRPMARRSLHNAHSLSAQLVETGTAKYTRHNSPERKLGGSTSQPAGTARSVCRRPLGCSKPLRSSTSFLRARSQPSANAPLLTRLNLPNRVCSCQGRVARPPEFRVLESHQPCRSGERKFRVRYASLFLKGGRWPRRFDLVVR